jgi:hypothetical protein
MIFRISSRVLIVLLAVLLLACPAWGHVGTANVFVQGRAGPYPVYVTITPPMVIPGEATVSVFTDGPNVRSVLVQANVLSGDLAHNMPQGVMLEAGPAGSHEFHGTAWIMTQGSWQVRLTVVGDAGSGTIAVPLPASPVRLMHMSKPFGGLLIVLGGLLIAGLASLAAAAAREAKAEPGAEPDASRRSLGYRAAVIAVCGVLVILYLGNRLWKQEIARYSGNIYQPLQMVVKLSPDDVLHLELRQPDDVKQIFSARTMSDLVLDHNHLMHLYVIRWPSMDVVYHLHPTQVSAGKFDLALPTMPEGEYRLFADVVHADGFPETAVADVHLDVPHGRALAGDDAMGVLPKLTSSPTDSDGFVLPDGYRYRFEVASAGGKSAAGLRVNVPVLLRFALLDAHGDAPQDMTNYMGMPGHAAIVKADGTVFAHIHPEGSVAMAAYMMANANSSAAMGDMNMSARSMKMSNTTEFPFGFPKAGLYRVIVQMKHGDVVETGAVDVIVR